MSDMSHPAAVGLFHFQGNACGLWFRQFCLGLLAVFAHEEHLLLLSFLRSYLEESSTPIECFDRIAIIKGPTFCCFSIFESSLESHSARQSLHEIAALGIEGEFQLAVLGLIGIEATHGAKGHIVCVFAWFEGLVIDGKHTTVELFIVSEILLLLSLCRKPFFYLFGMLALEASPIELPTRVCPKLIEPSILYVST